MTIPIPCDTITRLSNLLPRHDADVDEIFHTFRLDRGCVIVSDRKFGAVEHIGQFEGSWHIKLSHDVLMQCRTEAQFNGVLSVTPNQALGWTSARTTMGYNCAENIGVFPTEPTAFDGWYEKMVVPALNPQPQGSGALVCYAEDVARLGATSPSGFIVFEQHIDTRRPTLLRDINDHRWIGFFHPRMSDGLFHPPASVPSWLRETQ